MRKRLSACFLVVLLLCITGCSDKIDPNHPIIGKWEIDYEYYQEKLDTSGEQWTDIYQHYLDTVSNYEFKEDGSLEQHIGNSTVPDKTDLVKIDYTYELHDNYFKKVKAGQRVEKEYYEVSGSVLKLGELDKDSASKAVREFDNRTRYRRVEEFAYPYLAN